MGSFTPAFMKNVCERFKYIVSWNDNTNEEQLWIAPPPFSIIWNVCKYMTFSCGFAWLSTVVYFTYSREELSYN